VNVRAFTAERKPGWTELSELANRAGRRARRLSAADLRRLGSLYRACAADLALARHAYPGDPVVAQLEALIVRTRPLVYASPTRRLSFVEFVTTGYWRLIAERRVLLALSAALLFGSALLAGGWAVRDPGAAGGLVPSQYRSVTEPRSSTDLGLSADEEAALSSQIFTNNIRVTMLTFAAGITFGLGSAFLLLFNGTLLGTVGGLSVGAGNGRPFFELVTAHGVLELSCIVVAGAAGMSLGWSLLEPGRRTRLASLAHEARNAVLLILGTAPWLVVAGLVEGFVTPAGLGLTTVVSVGLALGILFWSLVVWRGGGALRAERAALRADTP
jgi:uncharacterized membrane protein SpoIIM required for sporulation